MFIATKYLKSIVLLRSRPILQEQKIKFMVE